MSDEDKKGRGELTGMTADTEAAVTAALRRATSEVLGELIADGITVDGIEIRLSVNDRTLVRSSPDLSQSVRMVSSWRK
jgi:hypothetical protein